MIVLSACLLYAMFIFTSTEFFMHVQQQIEQIEQIEQEQSMRRQVISSTILTKCLLSPKRTDCSNMLNIVLSTSYGISSELEIDTETIDLGEDGIINIKVSKTRPAIEWDLTFFHTVQYHFIEEVQIHDHDIGFFVRATCRDNPNLPALNKGPVSCGFVEDDDGNKIVDSQGFCCIEELLPRANLMRGDFERINQGGALDHSYSTSHCPRKAGGTVLRDGFEIGEARTLFEIKVEITHRGSTTELILTPNRRVIKVETGNIRVELLGSLARYRFLPDFSNTIIYYPQPSDFTFFPEEEIMLVPREKVTRYGLECNKVGSSYHTFRSEKGVCTSSRRQECFLGTLFFLANPGGGKQSEYKLINHRKLKLFDLDIDAASGERKQLGNDGRPPTQIPPIQIRERVLRVLDKAGSPPTQISIQMDVGKLRIIQRVSKGIIVSAVAEPVSLLGSAIMTIVVRNTGSQFSADYSVVVDCSRAGFGVVDLIPPQNVPIEPGESATLRFEIFSNQNIDVTNKCEVFLKDTFATTLDTKEVFFDSVFVDFEETNIQGSGFIIDPSTTVRTVNCLTYDPFCRSDSTAILNMFIRDVISILVFTVIVLLLVIFRPLLFRLLFTVLRFIGLSTSGVIDDLNLEGRRSAELGGADQKKKMDKTAMQVLMTRLETKVNGKRGTIYLDLDYMQLIARGLSYESYDSTSEQIEQIERRSSSIQHVERYVEMDNLDNSLTKQLDVDEDIVSVALLGYVHSSK